jgi:hypothetical protein
VLDAHDTPSISLHTAPVGAGGVCADHSVPFHRSAKGTIVPPLFTYSPTLVQAVERVHEAKVSRLDFAPVGLGVD